MPRYIVSFACIHDGRPDTGTIPVDTADVVVESVDHARQTGLGLHVLRLLMEQGADVTSVNITGLERVEVLP